LTYGTVRFDESARKWRIECQPHVALRLKRVFPKIDKAQHGAFSLTDTIDNARDLEWFLSRYPMTLADSGRLEARSRSFAERSSVVENLLCARIPPPTFDLAIPPRDYQRKAAGLLLARGGLLLADDVGLGKTCSGIATLADARTLPALVVTLAHLRISGKRRLTGSRRH
jgi:SNF2 family DNA or RNA helicase